MKYLIDISEILENQLSESVYQFLGLILPLIITPKTLSIYKTLMSMQIQIPWPIRLAFHVHQAKQVFQIQRIIFVQISEESTIQQCLELFTQQKRMNYLPNQAIIICEHKYLQLKDNIGDVFDKMRQEKRIIDLYYDQGEQIDISIEFKDPHCQKQFIITTNEKNTFWDVMHLIKEQVIDDPYFQHWTQKERYVLFVNGCNCQQFPTQSFRLLQDNNQNIKCQIYRLQNG